MDLLTQGLLGTAMAQAGAKQQEIRIATGIGFFSRHYSGCGYPDPIGKRSAAQYRISLAFHAFAVFRATWRFGCCIAAVAFPTQALAVFPVISVYFSRLLLERRARCIHQLRHQSAVAGERCAHRIKYHFRAGSGFHADFADCRRDGI